jgi:hypothetical protein
VLWDDELFDGDPFEEALGVELLDEVEDELDDGGLGVGLPEGEDEEFPPPLLMVVESVNPQGTSRYLRPMTPHLGSASWYEIET